MDHFCAICNSVFLLNGDETEADAVVTEIVTTSCGHVFHRDCITSVARQEGATCHICRASVREDNKFTKLFMTYEENEHDALIQAEVAFATAADKAALETERRTESLQRRLDILKEEQVYNQTYIEKLDNQLAAMQLMYRVQTDRLKQIEKRSDGSHEEAEGEQDIPV